MAKARRDDIRLVPVAEGVALVTGAGGNVVLVKGPRGVVVIDSGDAAHSAALFSLVRDYAGGALPVAHQ